MKKILAFLLALCLLCSPIVANAEGIEGPDTAKDTVISCTVPSSHKITAEAENSKVLINGRAADSFDVQRLQSPKLQIIADDGYVIKKVIYDGVDVTSKLDNGFFTAAGLYKDCALVVETEKSPDTPVGESPQTRDISNIWLWLLIMLVSRLSLFGIVITKKRKEETE